MERETLPKLLSLCMIVKNEEANLPRCLKSVKGAVDEIIIVDTGSTDRTVEIAAAMGAKVTRAGWNNNFSEARNASLELAAGKWIIFLDADEELAAESRQALRQLLENNSPEKERIEGYFVKIVNYIGEAGKAETCSDLVFRIFRNCPRYRFQGTIHEQIANTILQENPQAKFQTAEEVVIKHYGYLDDQVSGKDKIQRNLAIIKNELSEQPENHLLRYHYGVELFRARQYKEAAEEFSRASACISPRALLFPKLIRYRVMAYYSSRQFKQALAAAKEGLGLFPQYPDLYYYCGLIYLEEKEYRHAYQAFLKAASLPPPPTHYASFEGVRTFRAHYCLGQICETFIEEEEAIKFYLQSLREHPGFTPPLERIIYLLNPRENPDYALNCLEKVLAIETPEAFRLLGEIFFRQGAYSLASRFIEKSAPSGALPADLQLKKAICLIQEKRWLESLRILQEFPAAHPLYPLAKLNEVFCFWLQGNKKKSLAALNTLKSLGLSPQTQKAVSILEKFPKKQNSLQTVRNSPYKTPRLALEAETWPLVAELIQRTLEMQEKEKAAFLIKQIDFSTAPEHLLPVAKLFFQFGEEATAFSLLQEYLRRFSSAEACFLMAEICRRSSEFWLADYYYRWAIFLDPQEPRYYLSRIKLQEDAVSYWRDVQTER